MFGNSQLARRLIGSTMLANLVGACPLSHGLPRFDRICQRGCNWQHFVQLKALDLASTVITRGLARSSLGAGGWKR